MAVKYECDRCKRQYGSNSNLLQLTISKHGESKGIKDLCGDCIYIVEKAILPPTDTKA